MEKLLGQGEIERNRLDETEGRRETYWSKRSRNKAGDESWKVKTL